MSGCTGCLARGWLLARLAGWIERVAMNSPGKRARELLALDDERLAGAVGHPRPARLASLAAEQGVEEVAAALDAADAWSLCRHQADWPAGLDDLGAATPRALFGIGAREHIGALAERPAVAIVGARRASDYGTETAAALARELACAGLVVVSGLAYGVDAAAHRGALESGGRTVAVLGSGVDVAYPPGERGLYRRIVESGVVLSELPPGFKPFKWCFPARNRIIAAQAAMTVVIQARKRSGSLITSEMAADLGREVGAVPGQITSSLSTGTNALLADGAAVVRCAQDVLDRLLGVGLDAPASVPPPPDPVAELESPLALALSAVEEGAATPDEIAARSSLAAAEATTALARLELLGHVKADGLGRYSRASHGSP